MGHPASRVAVVVYSLADISATASTCAGSSSANVISATADLKLVVSSAPAASDYDKNR